MRLKLVAIFVVCSFFHAGLVASPQQLPSDPQASDILRQMVGALGGDSLRQTITDSIAYATVTLFGTEGKTIRSLVIKTKTPGKLRYELTADGTTTIYIYDTGQGVVIRDAEVRRLPYEQSYRADAWHLPLVAGICDSIQQQKHGAYQGLALYGKVAAHQIAFVDQSPSNPFSTPGGSQDTLLLFVDPRTFLPIALRRVYPVRAQSREVTTEEYQFADYRRVGGTLAPFSITLLSDGVSRKSVV